MAAIQKRNGRYRARVIRKGYPSYSKTFKTHKEASTWARQIETEIDQGVIKSSNTITNSMLDKKLSFSEAAEHYIKNHTIYKRNYKTETGTIRTLIRHWGKEYVQSINKAKVFTLRDDCLLYTSPSPRDRQKSRMPSSA